MGAIGNFFGDLKVVLRAARHKMPADNQIGSLGLLVQQNAHRRPNDIALLCEDEIVTWQALNERANRVAHSLKAQGVQPSDCVSIFMQNRIEFVVCLVGLTKLGAVAGLINTNLTLKPLTHCVSLVHSRKCIFGAELTEPLAAIRADLALKDGVDYLFVQDTGSAARANPVSLPNWAVPLNVNDPELAVTNPADTATITLGTKAFYLFTSGTTGLPKAAIVSHKRALFAADTSAHSVLRLQRSDRMYNCLPLYHGTGLMIGLMAAFQVGASSVIKRRLSVSTFWEDVRKYQCTCFVYIGEFIRYLMSKPELANDNQNPIRAIIGNGLRPDIWQAFQNRFNIERIGEFYGASEGNGGFANVFNKTCTVGLSSVPVKLVAYDIALDEVLRDAKGHCREVNPGETGLLLIQVTETSKFEGYTDAEASAKKLIKDVIADGDLYFNSGDLMKTVDVGFAFGQTHYQFVDRVGDTFRWKSENVSTNEIGEIINVYPDVIFSNVYGVEIPGADGRAGMAALVFRDGLNLAKVDLASLSAHIRSNMPSYARPLFIRILQELPTTTTHKLQKNALRAQAYHLDKVEDELLVLKPGDTCYSRLDTDFYDKIMAREVAF